MPEEVRLEIAQDLDMVLRGETPSNASPFECSEGGNIMKLVQKHAGDTYRVVYCHKFAHIVYVLHAFKKKSHSGKRTPREEINVVRLRFAAVREDYQKKYGSPSGKGGKQRKKREVD